MNRRHAAGRRNDGDGDGETKALVETRGSPSSPRRMGRRAWQHVRSASWLAVSEGGDSVALPGWHAVGVRLGGRTAEGRAWAARAGGWASWSPLGTRREASGPGQRSDGSGLGRWGGRGSDSACDWLAGGGAARDAGDRKGNSLPGRLGALPVFDARPVACDTREYKSPARQMSPPLLSFLFAPPAATAARVAFLFSPATLF